MNNSTFEYQSELFDSHGFHITLIVVNSFSGVLATVLNLLIIVTFVKTPSLRTPSNILILNLAITDFVVGAFVQPAYCTLIFEGMIGEIDLSYSILRAVSFVLMYVSLFTITAITVDRFLALHLHLRYQELVTRKRISMVVIMIWTSSVLWICLFVLCSKNIDFKAVIGYIFFFLFLSLILINIALMLKLSCVIHQHAVQIQLQQQVMNAQPGVARNIKRSVNMMYYILGAFFLCYFPCICFGIITRNFSRPRLAPLQKIDSAWPVVQVGVYTILFMNSSINPNHIFLENTRHAKFCSSIAPVNSNKQQ